MSSSQNRPEERRGYFRIYDKVHLTYEVVNEAEYSNAMSILNEVHKSSFGLSANFATMNHESSYLLNNIRRIAPETAQYLDLINQKIDILSQHLLEQEIPFSNNKLVTVNISASGIAFNSRENLTQGQPIKIRIILLPERIGIQAYGRIIDCKPDTDNNGFLASMDFEHIHNNDKELMIKHNLNKQMQELRKRSEEKE